MLFVEVKDSRTCKKVLINPAFIVDMKMDGSNRIEWVRYRVTAELCETITVDPTANVKLIEPLTQFV